MALQPAGGDGDKVFPPTYLGAKYATEERVVPVDGDNGAELKRVPCVLLDSVQAQANRMEEALQHAVDEGRIELPVIEVDFSKLDLIDPVGRITSLQAPHRVADAILRDSEIDGVAFRNLDIGKKIDETRLLKKAGFVFCDQTCHTDWLNWVDNPARLLTIKL